MAGSVLIIDAEEGFAGQLSAILRDYGLDSQQTGDGKLGMDIAKAQVPQAIVLCVELPRMSGYSICAKLKKDAQLKSIPLIITSAEATPETFEHHKKLKTRAEEYLKKPFAPSLLVQVLERYISIPKKGASNGHAEDMDEDLAMEDAAPVVLADDEAFSEDEAASIRADERPSSGHRGSDMSAIDEVLHGLSRPGQSRQGAPKHEQDAGTHAPSGFEEEDEIMTSVGFVPPPGVSTEAMSREIDELKAQLQTAKDAQVKAERERNEARANEKAATVTHTTSQPPASAAREVLGLKKELNAKDKEILELRDKLHSKDKELLDGKEREMELDTKVVQAEEEKAHAEALRDSATRQAAEAEERADAADARTADAEKKAQASDAKAAASDRRATQADMRANEEKQRAQQADQRSDASERARVDAEAILAEERREREQETTDLNRRLGEAAAHEAELDGALQAANQDAVQLREVIAEHEATIQQKDEHIEMLRAANQQQNQEITRLNNELSAARAEADNLRQELQVTQQALEDVSNRLSERENDLVGQRGENDGLRSTVQEMEHEREVSEGRIARAYQKIRDDEKIKGKARKAIEIALALLQEAGYAPDAVTADGDEAAGESDEARA